MKSLDEVSSQFNLKFYFKKLLILAIVVGAGLAIYTPNYAVFNAWARFAPQVALGYLLLGMVWLITKQTQLMLTTLLSCAFLCIYLRNASNSALELPKKTNEPILKLGNFNANQANGDFLNFLASIKKQKLDILSLQEITPDWQRTLTDSLKKEFPYYCFASNPSLQSLALFSRYPFKNCDTIYSENTPSLRFTFSSNYLGRQGRFHILASYIQPPYFKKAYEQLQNQLTSVAKVVQESQEPSITLGEYSIHASAYEIQQFRHIAALQDSRRGFRPDRSDGSISLFDTPTDHIFFTPHFNCIDFQTISGVQAERLGIVGTYQINLDSVSYGLSKENVRK
jgi:endonuclease/exonuclease/phosphatase (EEP) superfamily protein YafD